MKKICLFLLALFGAVNAHAELNIDITGGKIEPMPIAIAEFTGIEQANNIRQILQNDLESSGLFRVIDKDAYLQKINDIHDVPQFENWQAINAQALVVGNVEMTQDNQMLLSFRLWDVYDGQSTLSKKITLPQNSWRRLGHIMADMIYSRITGEGGYFDTVIVYVAESGDVAKKTKRLAMMDQDGYNHYYLTDGKTLVLTPRFAPSMQKIAYLSFDKGKPRIFLMDLTTMETADLGRFEGMNFAPRFSSDGKRLLLSQSVNGDAEIFVYDLDTKRKTRLTHHRAIDTSPCFSPDDQKIVFNSDRGGSQQLYVMNADGTNVKRISFGSKGSYATPVWSPRGDYIAFTKIQNNTFYIGVMRPDGSGERLLTEGFLVEGPNWAPNGRTLVYFKQQPYNADENTEQTGLYMIDVTGYNERYVPTPVNASDPAWSPLLFEKKM